MFNSGWHFRGTEPEFDDIATSYQARFRPLFADTIAEAQLASNVPMMDWYASDKGKEGREWWIEEGPQMVYRYIMAQRNRTTRVLRMPDGSPALEIEADMWIGESHVSGYIDRVMWDQATDKLIVEDDKTGSRWPQDHAQIDFYGEWVARELAPSLPWHGSIRAIWVRYWSARKGEYVLPAAVGKRTTIESLNYRYATLEALDGAGVYPARPSSMCKACPVRLDCPEFNPGDAKGVFELLLTSQDADGRLESAAPTEERNSMTEQDKTDSTERTGRIEPYSYPLDTHEGQAERAKVEGGNEPVYQDSTIKSGEPVEVTAPAESEGVDRTVNEDNSSN